MIDPTTGIHEDFERTQLLPALTPDVQLDEALRRERAARIEVVELMRQNVQQANEIEQLRGRIRVLFPLAQRFTHSTERRVSTEEGLFEVCGALKEALSNVLTECATRGLALSSGSAARTTFEGSCDRLEQILSAPGFAALAPVRADSANKIPRAEDSQTEQPTFRSKPVVRGKIHVRTDQVRPARVRRLELVR